MSKKPLQRAPKSLSNDYCVAGAKWVGRVGEREEGMEEEGENHRHCDVGGSNETITHLNAKLQTERKLYENRK